MFHSNKELFLHILEEINFLEEETRKISEDEFLIDNKAKRAFSRSIEIIGEAVKNISNDVIVKNPQISWRSIAGMRDKLIHGYFSVNYKLVWDVSKNVIPIFKSEIIKIMENREEEFS